MKRPNPKERDIEKAIRDILELDGWKCFHIDPTYNEKSSRMIGESGMPDLLCLRYGSAFLHRSMLELPIGRAQADVLWIEAKRPGGKVQPHQEAWAITERARGALVWIAGQDFPPDLVGFWQHYRKSGLCRRDFRIQGVA